MSHEQLDEAAEAVVSSIGNLADMMMGRRVHQTADISQKGGYIPQGL